MAILCLSITSHGEGLTGTRLTVGEYGSIEPIDCRVDNFFGDLVKQLFLSRVHIENLVEFELDRLFLIIYVALTFIFRNREGDLVLLLL